MISEKEWTAYFTKALKEQLKRNNMTQREVADRTGFTEATISRYANGSRVPMATHIVKLAKALNCRCDDLCMFERE